MEFVIKKPVFSGNKVKEFGVIVRMPTTECSEQERDYMRARYIAKLIEWKRAELEKAV